MEILPCDSQKPDSKILKKAISILKKGGVVAHATDTCYGFAASIKSKKGIRRLYKIKCMSCKKPVSILVSSLKEARKYGSFAPRASGLAKKYWPAPLTIAVPRKKSVPAFLNPNTKTIAIRYPNHKLSLKICQWLGNPITSTSANISRKPSPYRVSEILAQFCKYDFQPDLILDSGSLSKKNPPSTIVKWQKSGIRIIRQGGIRLK